MTEEYPILTKLMEMLPQNNGIVDTVFEGADIILYSNKPEFVRTCQPKIKQIVNQLKKRVEVRADQSILTPPDKAEQTIKEMIPKEAEVQDVWFDTKRSVAVIEAKYPKIYITPQITEKILEKTMWVPIIRRSPLIKSDLLKTIRYTQFQNSDYRRKLLHEIGKRIYAGFEKTKDYWIRISFLGAAREVGRSCLFLQTPESKILMDCGINAAAETRTEAFPVLNVPEFDITKLDAVIVSHAHVDHHAFIPFLYKYGYRGPVYCTEPTRDVMVMMQIDTINISQREGVQPPYNINDIKEMIKHTFTFEYGVVSDLTADVRLTLLNAGHVLGSSLIHLNIGDGYHNLLYTGDFKMNGTKLLGRAGSKFQRLETLIMESTYGKNVSPGFKESEEKFIQIINETLKNKGKVLLPVLGVGRAQEIIIILEEAMRKKKIPETTVYIDGMVWDINAIHTAYPEFFNPKISAKIFESGHNPFTSQIFKRVGSQKERNKIVEEEGSCIIMATSGMMVGGPSVFFFEKLADDKKNSLILTCYQPPGTLGRRLQDGERTIIKREGVKTQKIDVKLRVEASKGFSGHSDQKELVNYITKLTPKPKRVILVHGEKESIIEVAKLVHKKHRVETNVPRLLDTLRIR